MKPSELSQELVKRGLRARDLAELAECSNALVSYWINGIQLINEQRVREALAKFDTDPHLREALRARRAVLLMRRAGRAFRENTNTPAATGVLENNERTFTHAHCSRNRSTIQAPSSPTTPA